MKFMLTFFRHKENMDKHWSTLCTLYVFYVFLYILHTWCICVFSVFYEVGVRNFQAQRAIDKHWSIFHTLCVFYVLLYILCIMYISCIFCVVMYFEDLVRFVLELFKHREVIDKYWGNWTDHNRACFSSTINNSI